MRIRVDQSVCTGHAMCNVQSPELFPLDDVGYTALNGEYEIPAGQEESARRAVAACPERVFSIIEE
jgi:ferredoxin